MRRLSLMALAITSTYVGLCHADGVAANAPQVTPANPLSLVDGLESVFGSHAGFRRSGARGICASGYFEGHPDARSLTRASAFSGKRVPVIVRFSVGGGNPNASEKGKTVRGLAVQFNLPKGEQWLMANISAPVFSAATPESFIAYLEARRPDPATGKANPDAIAAANAAHPDFKPQIDWLKSQGVPASYGSVNYWGVNTFELVQGNGKSRPVKWQFEPVAGTQFLTEEQLKTQPDVFLAKELRERVRQQAVAFTMKFQLAEAGDVLDNPTVVLPASRKLVNVGTLMVTGVDAEGASTCDSINFNPLILPKGISASNDPTLLARPGSYAVSQGRRLAPPATSTVTPSTSPARY